MEHGLYASLIAAVLLDGILVPNEKGRISWKNISAAVPLLFVTLFSGCAATEPAPAYAPAPSTFDRAWSASLGAARDQGLQIVSEDRARGVISGIRGEQQVTIDVRPQADGNVRVEISARGPKGSDPGLAGRISRSYDRRMGR